MADLTEVQAAQAIKIAGASNTGAESNFAEVSSYNEIRANDSVNNGADDTVINLTTTPVEGKVGASRRTNRKYIWMQGITTPTGTNAYISWGFSNSTQSFKLFKDQLLVFPVGENTQIWFKVPTGTGSVAFGEGS